MTLQHNIYAAIASLGLLASCSSDIFAPAYTVGEADNAIVLRAGISEGGGGVHARAPYNPDANHAKHVSFTQGTKLALKVDGIWLGKGFTNDLFSQKTTATIGDLVAETGEKHREVTFTSAEQLYWDDYGTADPANISLKVDEVERHVGNGRDRGLDIFAAAVDGITTAPAIADNQWTALPWSLGTPAGTPLAISQAGGWSTKDLLTSNNVKHTDAEETTNAYKFSEHETGKLLEFTHAMTKVTVNLTAGEGFPGYTIAPADAKFQAAPTVTLLGFNYTGTVNVEEKTSTPTGATNILPYTLSGGANSHTASYDALVFPGNTFSNATDILKIVADGNTYYVNATNINAAMTTAQSNTTFEPGKNYVFNITISKTSIEVTATIKDWVDIEAETIEPVISIDASVGDKGATGGAFSDFDFYLSTTAASGYSKSAKATGTPDGATKWTFKDGSDQTITLHWPDHKTHYFMRGVSPSTTAVVSTTHVEVANGQYNGSTSPSNLLIGAPEITTGTMCGSPEHEEVDMSANGICARNNTINLNFQYVMSQVEVRLKSTGTDALQNKVTFDEHTTVEIIGGYRQARILLNTRVHDAYTEGDKVTDGKYALHARSLTTEETTAGVIKSAMHDIIVPQTLTDDMKFRITVTNSNGTQDVYETQLNKIKGKVKDSSDALAEITEWKPGEHYIYELDIKKTEINVTATLTDWKVVTAGEDVWF